MYELHLGVEIDSLAEMSPFEEVSEAHIDMDELESGEKMHVLYRG